MHTWKLQDAKARFSEVVKDAATCGPQTITVRGEAAVVIISKDEYDKLINPKPSFINFMRSSPLLGVDLEIKRDNSLTRETDL